MKGSLVCSKRLQLLVDSRCCNSFSTYQLLYSHWHFRCHSNLTGPQIHPISSIQLNFTQNVAGKLPFLVHQNCFHIKEHFLRKFKKILSRGFRATLIFCNIKKAPKPLDGIFKTFLKNVLWCANNFDAIKGKFTDYFLSKMQSNGKYWVYLGLCIVAMETKFMLGVQELIN